MKKLVAVLLTFLLILTGCNSVKVTKVKDEINETDAIRFSNEYKKVDKDNNFKYATYNNIIEIFEKSSGIIYLSYPSCVYCNEAAPILNEVAKEKKVKEIFYYNFSEIRSSNTLEYKKLTELLKDYIGEDESGNKRITAPTTVFVQNGTIKGVIVGEFTDEEKETKELSEESKNKLKEEYKKLTDEVYNADCDC